MIQVAALGWTLARERLSLPGLTWHKADPVFPALTCTAQATLRTARDPADHGMVANGLYNRELARALFWEQSSALVQGTRIWEPLRRAGKKVGMLFWQQSLGEDVDVLLSPKPIHKHHGGMIQDVYSRPEQLSARLEAEIGRPFDLMRYWGPLASFPSSAWIAAATEAILSAPDLAPDLLFTYLPHLDYDLQRHGPDSSQAFQSLEKVGGLLSNLWKTATECGYDVLVFGDYAIEAVTGGPVFPNRALRDAGLLSVRMVRGMAYPDFHGGRAFALVDHQIAHVYVRKPEDLPAARHVLEKLGGVADVLEGDRLRARGVDHPRSGELLLVAEKGYWLAYPWWDKKERAPDYASHVDIHNKPGYDPCELFFGWPPPGVSRNPWRVQGTHGRTGPGYEVAWATTLPWINLPGSLLELAARIGARERDGVTHNPAM